MTALDHYRGEVGGEAECLTLFSGDMLGPSIISSVVEGEQHVKPFNAMKVDAACIGNHELDFGIDRMSEILTQTMPPQGSCHWVMSNMKEKGMSKTGLGGLPRTAVIEKGPLLRIGFIGLSEQEWFETFNDLDVEVEFLQEKATAAELARQLRQDQGCNMVIALTH